MLAGLVSQDAVPPAARVSAAGILLDRGWGRAPQPHTGEDDKEIRVTIRNLIEESKTPWRTPGVILETWNVA